MTAFIRATDLRKLFDCDRRVYLDYHGDPSQRGEEPPYQQWLYQSGREHEQQVIQQRGPVTPIEYDPADLEAGFHATVQAMQSGADSIYHGVLLDGDLVGIPDMLIREAGPSRFGPHYYRPVDIKSGSTPRDGDRWQVMAYIALLEAIQRRRPDGALLLRVPPAERSSDPLGTVEHKVIFDPATFDPRLAEVRALAAGREPRPFIASACAVCPWHDHCFNLAARSQDVSLVSGLKRSVWAALHERGLGALPAAARADVESLINIKGVGDKTARHIIRQARALAENRSIQIAAPALGPPGPAIFLDAESEPLRGLTYLMGMLVQAESGRRFEYQLARQPEDEPAIWSAFLDHVESLPGPVYHYGHFEKATIARLTEKYGQSERADALADRLIDLNRVLKDAVVLPLYGYSLKEVAPWLGFGWSGDTQAAADSMLEYLAWLEEGDPARLERILTYNEDDCRALAAVYDWLASLPADPAP